MADLKSNIRTYLIGRAGITSEFGSSLTRIYIDKIDESITTAFPYATMTTVAGAPLYAHDGALPHTELVQIMVRSDAKSTANSGMAAIETELSAFSGTASNVTVGSSLIQDMRDGFEEASRLFFEAQDYSISLNG